MFCYNCGKQIDDDDKHCMYCGAKQEEENVEQAEPKPPTKPVIDKIQISVKSSINNWYMVGCMIFILTAIYMIYIHYLTVIGILRNIVLWCLFLVL